MGKKKGKVFVLDGPDGCSKTTQIIELTNNIRENEENAKVVLTREPYDFPDNTIGMSIRNILEHREVHPPNAEAFQYLFYLDRVEHWKTVLGPRREEGCYCLSDRERMVTYAHGVAGGVPLDMMMKWHDGLPIADLYIYMKVTAEKALERINKKNTEMGKDPDYFETKDRVQKNVEAFDWIARTGIIPNLVTVDANRTIEEIRQSIWNIVFPIIDKL